MVRRVGWFFAGLTVLVLCVGCGNSEHDKGKNSDKDRPKPGAAAN